MNHIDTAAMYGDAEARIGPWMEKHRDRFFLATKTYSRTAEGAWDNLRRPLDRLWAGSFLITAGDMQLLPKVLDAAARFEKRPSDEEMAALVYELGIKPIS